VVRPAFILKYTSYVNTAYVRVQSKHNEETLTEYTECNFCLLFANLRQLEPAQSNSSVIHNSENVIYKSEIIKIFLYSRVNKDLCF